MTVITRGYRGLGACDGAAVLRSATAGDREVLRLIHHRAFRVVVEDQFGAWDDARQDAFFVQGWADGAVDVILSDGGPVGYCGIEERAGETFVREFAIDPEFQGRGLGSAVLRRVMTAAERRRVPVRLQALLLNRAAGLYRRLGFVEARRTGTHILFEWLPPQADTRALV